MVVVPRDQRDPAAGERLAELLEERGRDRERLGKRPVPQLDRVPEQHDLVRVLEPADQLATESPAGPADPSPCACPGGDPRSQRPAHLTVWVYGGFDPQAAAMTPTGRQERSGRDTATARLLSAYRENDDARARERLVKLYMPLVEGLANRHDRRGAEHDDLVQAGSIGLLNAIERFDPKRGDEFAAFAVPTIAGEMKRHLRDRAAIVRLPRSLHEASVRLPRAREALTARLGRGPTAAELAAEIRGFGGGPRAAREHHRPRRRGDGVGFRLGRARGKRGPPTPLQAPSAHSMTPTGPSFTSGLCRSAAGARSRTSSVCRRARSDAGPTPRYRSCAPSLRGGRSPGGPPRRRWRRSSQPSRTRRPALVTAGG